MCEFVEILLVILRSKKDDKHCYRERKEEREVIKKRQ